VLLEQGGRAPEAESAYREAVALDSSDRDALRVLADLLARTGRKQEAQALRTRLRALPVRPSLAERGGVPAADGSSGEESKPGEPDTPR